MLKQSKRAPTEPEIGKEIPSRGDKPSTGYVGSLSLSKEVFQAQGPFLIQPNGGPKTACLRLPSPTVFIAVPKWVMGEHDVAGCFTHLTTYSEHSSWNVNPVPYF